MGEREVPLAGGNVTDGVVRVGDTVRRPSGPWSATVHAFLCHLHDEGIMAAPRSLGFDDRGRHVVGWIPGEVTHPFRRVSADDPTLIEVGRLVRQFHDASASWKPPADACWNVVMAPDRTDLVIHHDLGSGNFVHGSSRWVFIDWDSAAPGSRLWDLAWAAHGFTGLSPDADVAGVAARLRDLVDGYGLDADGREELVDLLPVRYQAMVDLLREGHHNGVEPWARPVGAGARSNLDGDDGRRQAGERTAPASGRPLTERAVPRHEGRAF